MSALDLLSEQHREVEDLLRRVKSTTGGERVRFLGDIAEKLTLHMALEERFFYPALREWGLGDVVDRSEREHRNMREGLSRLMDLKQKDPRLEEAVTTLERTVLEHVREEENEVFPRAKEKVDHSALDHAENAMRNAMTSLEEKELLTAAEEGQVPAP